MVGVHTAHRKVDIRLHGNGNSKLPWRKAGQQRHLAGGFGPVGCQPKTLSLPQQSMVGVTVGYEGMFVRIMTTFPLSFLQEPPYVSTKLPTVGPMDSSAPGYSKEPFSFRSFRFFELPT